MQRPLVISLSEDGGFCLVLLTFLCGLVEVSNQKPQLGLTTKSQNYLVNFRKRLVWVTICLSTALTWRILVYCVYIWNQMVLYKSIVSALAVLLLFFLRQFNLWRSVKTDKKLGQERRENTQKRPTVQTWTWHMVACSLTELNWLPSICFTINVTQCTTAPKDTLCISVRRQQLWQNGST